MSNIVIFNSGQVPLYFTSVDASEYSGEILLVNPNLSAVSGVPIKYWKHQSGSVVEMTQAEKDAWDTAVQNQLISYTRTAGKSYVNDFNDIGVIVRALTDTIKDEINILRGQHSLTDRTLAQVKTAIENKIDAA